MAITENVTGDVQAITLVASEKNAKEAEEKHNKEILEKVDGPKDEPQGDMILGKFKTQEDLVKAYQELEKKLSAPKDAPKEDGKESPKNDPKKIGEAKDKPKDAPKETPGDVLRMSPDDLQPFIDSFAETGEFTEAQIEQLKKAKLDPSALAFIVKGQLALARERDNEVFGVAGGQEGYTKMIEWAQANLDASEIKAFDAIMDTGDITQMKFAASSLHARMIAKTGEAPKKILSGSDGGKTPGDGYESPEEYMQDMRDPKYATDMSFRAKVEKKLRASKF